MLGRLSLSKDSKPDAWMPLYIGDWDSGTAHLDCEEDGAYGRLVRHYWKNGPLPDDDAKLARIVRMDLKRWRRVRPTLAAFFMVADGTWRHKRVDEELVRWAEKRAKAIERAAAGGRAKAAKSTATSTSKSCLKHPTSSAQAVLKGCTSASSTEVEGLPGHSTLCDANVASEPEARNARVPADIWEMVTRERGEQYAKSVLAKATWQDVPVKAVICATSYAADKLRQDFGRALKAEGITITRKDKAA